MLSEANLPPWFALLRISKIRREGGFFENVLEVIYVNKAASLHCYYYFIFLITIIAMGTYISFVFGLYNTRSRDYTAMILVRMQLR